MSKKKSAKQVANTIDDQLIEQPAQPTKSTSGEVSLKEFSEKGPFAFNKENYKFLFAGLGINVLGFLLMIGGAAESPDEFHYDEIFSHVRITLSPALIVLGYAIIMYAIMKKPKAGK